ncbi:MAG: helix-turn-helix transcriptional regulator [Paracoccaceae bacterium]|nr:helix-turn-helix transcriptional regulator [Paracoccaceae bacterium]
MLPPTSHKSEEITGFIETVGARVRMARQDAGLSRRALSERSGISQRYLAQLESGAGNISIALLFRVAVALGTRIEALIGGGATPSQPERARRICLIGLRGAGKSTLGRMAGEVTGLPFRELNQDIEEQTGLPVADVIALYGPEGYRKLERQALERVAATVDNVILAAAGGVVSDPETYGFLLSHFHTVWLKATPEDHMRRVRAQGDERPMAGNPNAMAELVRILEGRETLYARADRTVSTAGKQPSQSLADLLDVLDDMGFRGVAA